MQGNARVYVCNNGFGKMGNMFVQIGKGHHHQIIIVLRKVVNVSMRIRPSLVRIVGSSSYSGF